MILTKIFELSNFNKNIFKYHYNKLHSRKGLKMKNYNTFDIVLVNFGQAEFDGEQGGIRPAVIIQNSLGNAFSGTTIVIPFTTKIKHLNQPTHALFCKGQGGLKQDSMLLGECLRQVSKERIMGKVGKFTELSDKREIKRAYDANFGEVA